MPTAPTPNYNYPPQYQQPQQPQYPVQGNMFGGGQARPPVEKIGYVSMWPARPGSTAISSGTISLKLELMQALGFPPEMLQMMTQLPGYNPQYGAWEVTIVLFNSNREGGAPFSGSVNLRHQQQPPQQQQWQQPQVVPPQPNPQFAPQQQWSQELPAAAQRPQAWQEGYTEEIDWGDETPFDSAPSTPQGQAKKPLSFRVGKLPNTLP